MKEWNSLHCIILSQLNYVNLIFFSDDPCSETPCKNNGICYYDEGSYNCKCVGTFFGRHCEYGIFSMYFNFIYITIIIIIC